MSMHFAHVIQSRLGGKVLIGLAIFWILRAHLSTTTFIGNWRRAPKVGVPDRSEFEHIVRLAFECGEAECANL